MTIDEELTQLDDLIRRLKIEYDIYFNGARDRPPYDLHWRVEGLLKKYGDTQRLSFAQRFRFNSLVQRFAIYNDLWRQKVKLREEGREPARRREEQPPAPAAFKVEWQDPDQEPEKVEKLFQALVEARKKAGEAAESLPLDNFRRFVKQKTEQLKKDFGCRTVEYVVAVEDGQVRLRAKGT